MLRNISNWLDKLNKNKFIFGETKLNKLPILNLLISVILLSVFLTASLIATPLLSIMYLIKGIYNLKTEFKHFKLFLKSLIPINIGKIIDNYEKKLLKDANYYHLGKFVLNRELDLKTFIKNFIREYNSYYNTYHDLRFICDKNKRRSLGDIFLICRCYFPTCTLKEVLGYLIELLENGKIYGSYCSTINKYVFHYQTNIYYNNQPVEYDENLQFIHFVNYYEKLKK